MSKSNIIIALLMFFAGMLVAGLAVAETTEFPYKVFEVKRAGDEDSLCLLYWFKISKGSGQGDYLFCWDNVRGLQSDPYTALYDEQ